MKSGITCVISHSYAKTKTDLFDLLPFEKNLTFRVIKLIKIVWNKKKNNYYYNKFLEKCSYQSHKKNNRK